MRVDWHASGAFSVFVPADGPGSAGGTGGAGGRGGAGRRAGRGGARASAARHALQRRMARVPGLRLREFLPVLAAGAAALGGFAPPAAALQAHGTALYAADEAAEAAEILAQPSLITQPVAAALIAPLVLYRAAATAAGETVRPTTDFAILAALASFVYRFYL